MSKAKTRWVCQECGFQSSRFLGKCTECENWNSFVEEFDAAPSNQPLSLRTAWTGEPDNSSGPQTLSEVEALDQPRLASGSGSVDTVLGGGFVPGSAILLAGDPGIGKSTLLLQTAAQMSRKEKVLYVSAEESKQQVGMRARRLGIDSPNLLLDSEHNVTSLLQAIEKHKPRFVAVDSVQAIYHPELTGAPGSVSQVKESAGALVNAAKSRDVCVVLVGHVTKDGGIAGPRVLEHMVDVVLHFEGDRTRQLRLLRTIKNRFGSTQEIAIFTMEAGGLKEVDNASALFLHERLSKREGERAPSGTAVLSALEGRRSLLLEVQALVAPCITGSGRRVANGCDYNRVLQIIAVLEKRVGLPLARQDVYVNIVGGFEFGDPAGDLAIASAIATSCLDRSADPFVVCIGELGLSGELRPVSSLEQRLKEAAKMGFKRAIVPSSSELSDAKIAQLAISRCGYLSDALSQLMPGFAPTADKQAAQEVKL